MLVYSATHFGPEAPLFHKQLVWTMIGIVLMLACLFLDYRLLMEASPFLYSFGIVLLLYVLVYGRVTRHVKSWIHVGSFQFQPAEFMKIFTALLLAKFFDSNDRAYLDLRNFLIVMALIGLPVVLIAVLVLYLFLVIESLSVAKQSRDRGGTFLVLALICFFIFHIIINVGMQIGLLPVTGIPLPLISYGGSATMMFFMSIGLILNVDFRKFVKV